MSKAATVDTKRLKQAVRRLGTAAERSASNAVKVAITQANAFYMSFDETEAVPYTANTEGRIVVSSRNLDNLGSIEDVLAAQTQIAVDTMNAVVQSGIKEVLE